MAVTLGGQPYDYAPFVLDVRGRRPLEHQLEEGLAGALGSIPGRRVYRQVRCCGPILDLVTVWGSTICIVELKRWEIGWRALEQLTGYVEHWSEHARADQRTWTIYGVLAAPRIRPSVARALPWWCAFAPLQLRILA